MFITGVFIAVLTIVGIVYSRLITTFFHELGHAIPALILSSSDVVMYVGSYGNPKKSLTLKFGRLFIILSFNIWKLELGLCTHKGGLSNGSTLAIILGGPFMSLLFAFLLIWRIVDNDLSEGAIFIHAIFIASCIWDFLVNLVPRSQAMKLYDGSEVYNDGMQIKRLLSSSKLPEEHHEIKDLIENNDIANAKHLIHEAKSHHPRKVEFRELELDILWKEKDFKNYIQHYDLLVNDFDLRLPYLLKWAKAKIKLHEYDDVIAALTNLLQEGKNYYEFHFLRGKALVELGEYRDALIDFHALTLGNEKEDTLALANRAYCQFKLDYKEEAIEDIKKAIREMKVDIAEVYFLAGQILSDTEEEKALEYYKKAEEMNYEHHALAFNIAQLESM